MQVQSPYTARAHNDVDAIERRRSAESDEGDLHTLYNLFAEWVRTKRSRENSQAWCARRGLEQQRLYEVVKLRVQFQQLLRVCALVSETANFVAITVASLLYCSVLLFFNVK